MNVLSALSTHPDITLWSRHFEIREKSAIVKAVREFNAMKQYWVEVLPDYDWDSSVRLDDASFNRVLRAIENENTKANSKRPWFQALPTKVLEDERLAVTDILDRYEKKLTPTSQTVRGGIARIEKLNTQTVRGGIERIEKPNTRADLVYPDQPPTRSARPPKKETPLMQQYWGATEPTGLAQPYSLDMQQYKTLDV